MPQTPGDLGFSTLFHHYLAKSFSKRNTEYIKISKIDKIGKDGTKILVDGNQIEGSRQCAQWRFNGVDTRENSVTAEDKKHQLSRETQSWKDDGAGKHSVM